jgi:hypothetical protein
MSGQCHDCPPQKVHLWVPILVPTDISHEPDTRIATWHTFPPVACDDFDPLAFSYFNSVALEIAFGQLGKTGQMIDAYDEAILFSTWRANHVMDDSGY